MPITNCETVVGYNLPLIRKQSLILCLSDLGESQGLNLDVIAPNLGLQESKLDRTTEITNGMCFSGAI